MEFHITSVRSTARDKVVFAKGGVQIHPDETTLDDDYLEGTIQIVERANGEVMIEWRAERCLTGVSATAVSNETPQERSRHNLQIDVRYLKSIRRVTPTGGWPYLTFYAKDGTQYPPLHFHERGTIGFLEALGKYVSVTRSQSDNHIYMVSEHDKEALVKSFNELAIFPDTHSQVSSQFAGEHGGDSLSSRVSNFFRGRFVPAVGKSAATRERDREWTPSKASSSGSISAKQSENGFGSNSGRVEEITGRQDGLKSTEFNFVAENDGEFELVSASPHRTVSSLALPPRRATRPRGAPVTDAFWRTFIASNGSMHPEEIVKLKASVFRGSLDPTARKEGWKALLGYLPMNLTREQKLDLLRRRKEEYYAIKLQWRSVSTEQEANWTAFRERRSLIEKDVHRTDRDLSFFSGENNPNLVVLNDILVTYTFYNQDLGYVQGMSDLLAPCLQVLQDEVDAFWCFVGLMRRLASNFEMDQSSMKRQLGDVYRVLQFLDPELCNHLEAQDCQNMYFCFRWLLIHFKREFTLQDTMRLWEALWSDLPCRNYALLIAVAILDRERGIILENNYGYSEILRHVNSLARQISLDDLLQRAEVIFMQLYDAFRTGQLPEELADLFALADADPIVIGFELQSDRNLPENFMANQLFGSEFLQSTQRDTSARSVDLRAASVDYEGNSRKDLIDDFQKIAGLNDEAVMDAEGLGHVSLDDGFQAIRGGSSRAHYTVSN